MYKKIRTISAMLLIIIMGISCSPEHVNLTDNGSGKIDISQDQTPTQTYTLPIHIWDEGGTLPSDTKKISPETIKNIVLVADFVHYTANSELYWSSDGINLFDFFQDYFQVYSGITFEYIGKFDDKGFDSKPILTNDNLFSQRVANDGTFTIYDLSTQSVKIVIQTQPASDMDGQRLGPFPLGGRASISPDKKIVAFASIMCGWAEGSMFQVYSLSTGEMIHAGFPASECYDGFTPFGEKFSSDGRFLAVNGSHGDGILIFNTNTWEITNHILASFPIAFSKDGKYLAAHNIEGNGLLLVHLDDNDIVQLPLDIEDANNLFVNLVFTPDGSILSAAMGYDGIKFWNTSSGELIPVNVPNLTNFVGTVAFSPDGRWMASYTSDINERIGIWGIYP